MNFKRYTFDYNTNTIIILIFFSGYLALSISASYLLVRFLVWEAIDYWSLRVLFVAFIFIQIGYFLNKDK